MFQSDAIDLLNARQKARQAHAQGSIRDAGDEVEIMARELLKKRYTGSAYATHGHIVDSDWKVSPQLDFIICDPIMFPVWNVRKSGAENILFDSVYAVGEIKSSFYKTNGKHPIVAFGETLKSLKSDFVREKTNSFDRLGINVTGGLELTSKNTDPFRNPLYSFMLFVDSSGIDMGELRTIYQQTFLEYLPSAVCFLDRGCLVSCTIASPPQGGSPQLSGISVIPEFDVLALTKANNTGGSNIECKWVLTVPADKERLAGANLMLLHALKLSAIRRIILKPSDITTRLLRLASFGESEILA